MEITAYGIPLTPVTSFKYLGRFILEVGDDWPAVVNNLQISRKKWARLTRVLIREGADAWTLVHIYLAMVQLVMMYGLDTWVMAPRIGRVLRGSHHRVAQRLKVRQPWIVQDVVWVYPPLEDMMAEAVLHELDTYVSLSQNTVAQFIVTRSNMEQCMEVEHRKGSRA